MGSALGALKAAATRIGVTVDEYRAHIASGRKWCTGCKNWHPVTAFLRDPGRTDGLAARCQEYRNRKARQDYKPRPRPSAGRRFVSARDGDEKQARRRVNHLVDVGLLAPPNSLPCADCGHVWTPGEKRHEYDHHLGYAPEHHEHVEPVCTSCHASRTHSRNGTY